jgi:hypothetical protein
MADSSPDKFHAMLQAAQQNQVLLEWFGGIAVASFVAAAIGGKIGRGLMIIVTVAGLMLVYPAATGNGLNYPWTPKVQLEGMDRITVMLPVVGLLGLLLSLRKVPGWAGMLAMVLVPALVVAEALLPHKNFNDFTGLEWKLIWMYAAGAAVVAGAVGVSTEAVASRQKGIAPVLVAGLFAAGVAGLLINTGEAKLGTLAAGVGMSILGALLGGLCTKRPQFDTGPVFVWITALVALLAYGSDNTDEQAPIWLAVVCVAPLLGWVAQVNPVAKWKPWKRELARGLVVGIPIVTVLVIASMKSVKAAGTVAGSSADDTGGWNYGG